MYTFSTTIRGSDVQKLEHQKSWKIIWQMNANVREYAIKFVIRNIYYSVDENIRLEKATPHGRRVDTIQNEKIEKRKKENACTEENLTKMNSDLYIRIHRKIFNFQTATKTLILLTAIK